MLQHRTILSALLETSPQRCFSQAARSKAPLPRLPQPSQLSAQRQQQRAISQLSQKRLQARSLTTLSWQNLGSSPLRILRRFSDDKPAQSLSGRFKELSRKYGWAAVGVYVGLSVLDFPFCFMAVRLIGPDRVGKAEHAIVDGFWQAVAVVIPSLKPQEREVIQEIQEAGEDVASDAKLKKEEASIWTQLLLAYGLHKSLLVFRVPLTAAVTPKIVKTLRSWGYNIGPRVKK